MVDAQGFQYRAERPEEATFTGQKWGWTGVKPGGWVMCRCALLHGIAQGA